MVNAARPPGLDLDASTIDRARGGDPGAITSMWRALNPALLRFLYSVGVRDADDVASQVWLEVVRALDRIPSDAAELRGLLFTIARRRSLDERRRQRRRPEVLLDDWGGYEQLDHDPSGEVDSVLRAVELLATLPADQAELVALRVVAGFSAAETAVLTERSEGAVRVATMRALRSLRDTLERDLVQHLA